MVAKIIDEFTDRDDLNAVQRWQLRHPEKYKEIYKRANKRAWALKPYRARQHDKARERERWAAMDHRERATKALKSAYGITFFDYEKMVIAQDYKCATCGKEVVTEPGERKGVIDHCHTKGHIRGILCNPCNRALGLIYDNPETLKRMIEYLE